MDRRQLHSQSEASSNGGSECGQGAMLLLRLPPPSESTDPLFAKKMYLLSSRNLGLEFQVPVLSSLEAQLRILDKMVQVARILHLTEAELYFVQDGELGMCTPINELESLNSILLVLNSLQPGCKDGEEKCLCVLKEATLQMISSVGSNEIDEMRSDESEGRSEELLLKWGLDHSVTTKLKISYFKEAGRGMVASEDLNVRDIALEVPEALIICEDILHESDMRGILEKVDGITAETMMLLWSMKERFNPSSKFRNYFETLPLAFNTGLSFGIDALAELEGTLLFDEIFRAREHLRKQYDNLCPDLCNGYPEVFPPEIYTWDHFLWACELWYSNSMKVIFSDGKLRTCLMPIAGLLNHSIYPHILHYGRVDSASHTLKFRLSRPCKAGQQCYLNYGSHPSSHFITFYGFIPKGNNPCDVIPLDFDDPDGSCQPSNNNTGWTTHMVRGTWLSRNKMPPFYGLPSPLFTHLATLLKNSGDEQLPKIPTLVDASNDKREVLETIMSIFNPMLEELGKSDAEDNESSSWDVKLALQYKDLQCRIISSVLSSCAEGLKALVSF